MARYIRTNYTKNMIKKGLEQASLKELRQVSHSLFSTVNKRIKRIQSSGQISPAVEGLMRSRGNAHFSTAGKDLKALQREYAEALAFYNRETGTLAGARNFTNHLKSIMGERVTDKAYINSVFDLLHGVEERLPIQLASNMIGTNDILNDIAESAVENDLVAINSETASREDFISKAIDRLTDQIDDTIKGGINDLDAALARAQSRLF